MVRKCDGTTLMPVISRSFSHTCMSGPDFLIMSGQVTLVAPTDMVP